MKEEAEARDMEARITEMRLKQMDAKLAERAPDKGTRARPFGLRKLERPGPTQGEARADEPRAAATGLMTTGPQQKLMELQSMMTAAVTIADEQ